MAARGAASQECSLSVLVYDGTGSDVLDGQP
jgi:hypothetical protein